MLAVIAIGPAIEGAVLDRGHVVRHEVAADLVALIDRGPERAARRLPAESVRVAQARGEDPVRAGRDLDLPDRGAAFRGLHAVLADIAVRTDRDIELGAVGAGRDVLGPVMV